MNGCALDVVAYMKRHQLVLATAESCTSGLIAAEVADVQGAGGCLDRAFITYSVNAKTQMLGVRQETINRHNLTSESVAAEMALGALAASDANVTISNTGVVDSTDPDIPAGTQCFGWAFLKADGTTTCFTESVRFPGNRRSIRESSADYALSRLSVYHARISS